MQAFFASFANTETVCFQVKRLKTAAACALAILQGISIYISRLSRPAGRSKRTFTEGGHNGKQQPFPFTALPVKRVHRSVPRSKKAAAQKVQRLCGVSHHSQRSAMIHHIPGRLIRPSRCSNTISMVFSFQTVRFSRTAPLAKTEAALKSCRRPKG